MAAVVQEANRRVYEHAGSDDTTSGMGTTMTVALVENGTVAIGHVGDSRAYLVRDGALEQLTEDHSLVAELIRSGKLSPEEAESHPQRSVITRALGTDPDVDVDTFTIESRPGDVFLLCSDGLTSMVGDAAILEAAIEVHGGDLDRAARELVTRANHGGGEDNITVVFFEIAEDGAAQTEATAVLPTARRPRRTDEGRRGHARRARPGPGRRHAGVQGRGGRGGDRRHAGERAQPAATALTRVLAVLLVLPRARRDRPPRHLGPARLTVRLIAAAESRAPQPRRRRPAHGHRLRERLHRPAGRDLVGVALVRRVLPRVVPRRPRGRAIRRPARRPVYLLPIAALLTAIGITEIYRLEPTDAFRQGLWVVVGVAAFAGTLLALPSGLPRA